MIRVWHVDSDELVREAVGLTLASTADICIERSFSTTEELAVSPTPHDPDLVVIDPWTQPISAFHPFDIIAELMPDAAILAHTARTRSHEVGRVLVAGARGLVHKRMGRFALLRAIRQTAASFECVVIGLDGAASSEGALSANRRLAVLTPRELEVVQCVAIGQTSKQAAELLGVSNRTVETHRRNIMSRLKLKSRAELVRLAVLAGLGPPDGL